MSSNRTSLWEPDGVFAYYRLLVETVIRHATRNGGRMRRDSIAGVPHRSP
jgi:hypothetical protein